MSVVSKLFTVKGVEFDDETPNTASLYKKSISIAWPAAVEGALLSIIGSIDTMMVGALGKEAIAAVGLVGQPRMILLVLAQALCVGTTAVIARRKGADDQKGANECFRQSMFIITLLGIVLGAVGYALAEPFIKLAGGNEDTLQLGVDYFKVICLGIPCNCWLLCICAAFRGIGKTRITMATNVIANLINVFFNYCLIGGHFGFPALGVKGAAIATVIGTVIATIIGFFFALRPYGYLRFRLNLKQKMDKETLKSLVSVGGSSVAESVFLRIGFLITNRLVADLGTDALAANQVVSQVTGLSFTLGDGIAAAGTSLVGQSLGAGRKDKAKAYIKITRVISYFTSIALMLIIFFFRRGLAELFTNDATVIAGASVAYLVVVLGMIPQNGRIVFSGCLRGAGDVRFVALISLFSVTLLRPLTTWVLCYPLNPVFPFLQLSYTGTWISFLIDSLVRDFLLLHRINTEKWANIKL